MKLKKLEMFKDDIKMILNKYIEDIFALGMRIDQIEHIKILFYKAVEIVEDGIKVKDVSYLNAIHAIYQHKNPLLDDED